MVPPWPWPTKSTTVSQYISPMPYWDTHGGHGITAPTKFYVDNTITNTSKPWRCTTRQWTPALMYTFTAIQLVMMVRTVFLPLSSVNNIAWTPIDLRAKKIHVRMDVSLEKAVDLPLPPNALSLHQASSLARIEYYLRKRHIWTVPYIPWRAMARATGRDVTYVLPWDASGLFRVRICSSTAGESGRTALL